MNFRYSGIAHLFLIFRGHKSFLWGLVMSALGFKARVLHLCSLSPVCNGFLRFNSGVTPADILTASMAAKLFHSCYCVQALVVIRHMLHRLSQGGSAIF